MGARRAVAVPEEQVLMYGVFERVNLLPGVGRIEGNSWRLRLEGRGGLLLWVVNELCDWATL